MNKHSDNEKQWGQDKVMQELFVSNLTDNRL